MKAMRLGSGLVLAWLLLCPASSSGQQAAEASGPRPGPRTESAGASASAAVPLYRIVLTDGQTLASYGEWTRVGEAVVFSLYLGEHGGTPRLHLATLDAARVDWSATAREREAVHAAAYAARRGEADYAEMTREVTAHLNAIVQVEDRAAQLRHAEAARRLLAEWPATHHFYRAREVQQFVSLLDDIVGELRASVPGARSFALDFGASTVPAEPPAPTPPPTLQESIQQALLAARLTPAVEERRSLLESAEALLAGSSDRVPGVWRAPMLASVRSELAVERRADRDYRALQRAALHDARRAASRADVRGVERALTRVRQRDVRLGHRRPQLVTDLVARLEAELDAARRLRLARDQWAARMRVVDAYASAVDRPLDALRDSRRALEDIRRLAGPSPRRLERLDTALTRAMGQLRGVIVPAEATVVHGVLTSALQLAATAVRLRTTAVATNDMPRAWEASSAAAGAMLLVDRVHTDLRALRERPSLP